MTLEEKMELLADVFDLETEDFEAGSVLADMEEWDSLSKLGLIAETKKHFNKRLTPEEIKSFETIQDILDYFE